MSYVPKEILSKMPRLAEALEAAEARKGEQYASDLAAFAFLVNNIIAMTDMLDHAVEAHGCFPAKAIQLTRISCLSRSKDLAIRLGVSWHEVISTVSLAKNDIFSPGH